jgi:hypothetical protein
VASVRGPSSPRGRARFQLDFRAVEYGRLEPRGIGGMQVAELAAVTHAALGGGPAALSPQAPACLSPGAPSPAGSAPSSASTSPLALSGTPRTVAKRSARRHAALSASAHGPVGAPDAAPPRDQQTACGLLRQESTTAPCPPLRLPAAAALAAAVREPSTPQESDRLAAAAAGASHSLDGAASSPGAASGSDAGHKDSRAGSPEPGGSLSRPGSASSAATAELALHLLPPPALAGLPAAAGPSLVQLAQLQQQQQLLLAYEQLAAAAPGLGLASAAGLAGARHAANAVPPGVIGTFFPVVRPLLGSQPFCTLPARSAPRRPAHVLRVPPGSAATPGRPQRPALPRRNPPPRPAPPRPPAASRSAPARRRPATRSTLPSALWRSASAPQRSGP